MKSVDTTVVISTYNAPDRLEKTLWGYRSQSVKNFEIVVADDGSTGETRRLIKRYQDSDIPLHHVWHEDDGFQKNRILNKALCKAKGQYCIFTDGDCVPRNDFVETHQSLRRPNQFLAIGSHINLPTELHEGISQDDVTAGRVFSPQWLADRMELGWREQLRLGASSRYQPLLNFSTHRPTVFTGNGSSVWREAAMAINGFDERMRYGGEDKDFGIRLVAYGLRSRMCKFSLICLHLDHPRPYVDPRMLRTNRKHLWRMRWQRTYWTNHGIRQNNGPDSEAA